MADGSRERSRVSQAGFHIIEGAPHLFSEIEKRRVKLIDGFKLLFIDLDRIEQAGIPARRSTDLVDKGAQFYRSFLKIIHEGDLTIAYQVALQLGGTPPLIFKAPCNSIAQDFICIPAVLPFNIAFKTGDERRQLFERVLLAGNFLKKIFHGSLLR